MEGSIRDNIDAIDALTAGFPAGTVSGAPKISAMELIDDLEPDRRGVYAGAIGYISVAGDLDTCIALRTAIVKDQTMHVQAGAGIIYDSDREAEYEETLERLYPRGWRGVAVHPLIDVVKWSATPAI